jgi:ketosteroid isomerase-like protein
VVIIPTARGKRTVIRTRMACARIYAVFWFLTGAFVPAAVAQTPAQNADSPRGAIHADPAAAADSEVKTLEAELAKLTVAGDRDGYAKHLAADYVYVREDGMLETRDDVLAEFSDAKRKIIFMEPDAAKMVIHVYGDTAIASAEFSLTARESGQVRQHMRRLTHVFVKRGGEWVLIAGQATTAR